MSVFCSSRSVVHTDVNGCCVALCGDLINRHTLLRGFPGGFCPHLLHTCPVIYFWRLLIPVIVTSLNLKQTTFTFGSEFYEFFFSLLTMQVSIQHHFKECEKENSLIKMLFMKRLVLFLHHREE